MTRIVPLALTGLLLLATPAAAGAPEDYPPCPASTQDCLDEMVKSLANRGWVGIEMDDAGDDAMKLTLVVPGSPADHAGLQAGDLLLGVQGFRYSTITQEQRMEVQAAMGPGKTITFLVGRDGTEREVPVVLGAMPDRVRWQIIGHHMMSHAGREGSEQASLPMELSVEQVAKLAKAGTIVLVDANGTAGRKAHGVIPGARLLTSAASYDVAELPEDKGATLVFYCANTKCTASDAAAKRAKEAGYTDVHVLRAGIMGWTDAGQPAEKPGRS